MNICYGQVLQTHPSSWVFWLWLKSHQKDFIWKEVDTSFTFHIFPQKMVHCYLFSIVELSFNSSLPLFTLFYVFGPSSLPPPYAVKRTFEVTIFLQQPDFASSTTLSAIFRDRATIVTICASWCTLLHFEPSCYHVQFNCRSDLAYRFQKEKSNCNFRLSVSWKPYRIQQSTFTCYRGNQGTKESTETSMFIIHRRRCVIKASG